MRRFNNHCFIQQPPCPYNDPPLFVIPSVPGFPASLLSPSTTYVVLLKENHMQVTEAALSTGNPGKSRDLQFRGPLLETRNDKGEVGASMRIR
jgi:hypothetical protein